MLLYVLLPNINEGRKVDLQSVYFISLSYDKFQSVVMTFSGELKKLCTIFEIHVIILSFFFLCSPFLPCPSGGCS